MNVILNVTAGVVPKEKDFFLRAFGHNPEEFSAILTMPDDYIRYRDDFEKNGLIEAWQHAYAQLDEEHKSELVHILSEVETEVQIIEQGHTSELNFILQFYTVRKRKMEENPSYYYRLLGVVSQE